MRKWVLGILSLLFLCGCTSQPLSQKDDLKIVVASDIHYFLKDYYQECEWFEESMLYGDGKMVTYADEILDAFMNKMLDVKPDFVVLTGDLTFNGEIGSHQDLAKRLSQLDQQGISVMVLPGNHDVDNIFTKGYGKEDYFEVDNIDAKKFREIYKNLGYQEALHTHKDSLSYSLSLNKDLTFIMLDSTAHELTGSSLDSGGYLTESTYNWLEKELKDIKKQGKIPLIAMHHNLAIHNELLNQGYTIRDNEKISQLFQKYDVPFVLSGHIHCQNIKEINGIYDIASSSLLDAPLQYGVIDINKDGMKYHTELLTISEDSDKYFDSVSRNRFSERLEIENNKDLIVDALVLANRYYFAGTIAEHKNEIMNMKGYSLLMESDSFYEQYLKLMMNEDRNHNQLEISFYK